MTTRDLLFEIGCEEMPSGPLNSAVSQLETKVPALLDSFGLTFGEINILSTPRRLAILVRGLGETTPDVVALYKGPAVKVAFIEGDPSGQPSKALLGFARSKGVNLEEIEVRTVEGVDYIFAQTLTKGGAAVKLLPEVLQSIINGIEWKRSQRWGAGNERFVRPVRWLLAIYGSQVIPVRFGHLVAENLSHGHRFLAPKTVEISALREYKSIMKGNHVIVDHRERRTIIEREITAAAKPFGEIVIMNEVLDEVVNLTEFPNIVVGTFDEEFLRCPREILEYAMAKHQRYFAIQRPDGTLDNHFVVVSNGNPKDGEQIARGHERVVRARLSDAAFFYDEDLKIPLVTWREKLGNVVFQEKLGTSLSKVNRVEKLVASIASKVNLDVGTQRLCQRAAHLAKADLVTSAVVEFPVLQGVMGRYYALANDEPEAVARAIEEHYRPKFSGDQIPSTEIGQIVSVADKLDTIVGIFAAGKAPKGTSDPFALRRCAIGVLQIALNGVDLDIDYCIDAALEILGEDVTFVSEDIRASVTAFFKMRLETILKDAEYSQDTISAVLAVPWTHPRDAAQRCKSLESFKTNPDMTDLSVAFERAKNLSNPIVGCDVEESLLSGPERELFEALKVLKAQEPKLLERQRYDELLERFAQIRPLLDRFFDAVMVMDEDSGLRSNRLSLLNILVALVMGFADVSKMVVKK